MLKNEKIIKKMSLAQKCYLLSGKDFWSSRSYRDPEVPSIFLSDGPHGVRKQEGAGDQLGIHPALPATCFPTAATMANSWDTDLAQEIGCALGEEAASQDVGVLLGPGLNMKRSPLCGRNFEYFSEDPYLAGKMAAAYIRGIQSEGIAACPKHFAVNNTELRRQASDSVIDERTLREIYLTAFEIAVKEGDPISIMSSYNMVNEVYANENSHLLDEILRKEWGFSGFVVSDWGSSNDYVEGVRSGMNLEMPSCGGDSGAQLIDAVKQGRISEEIVDQRVDEFLSAALPIRRACDQKKGQPFDQDAHHALAQKASEQSIVLLKNEDQILPLSRGAKVAVIGEFAGRARYQGAGSSAVNCTKLEHAMDVIDQFDLSLAGYEPGYPRTGKGDAQMEERAVSLAKKAPYVLLYLGLDEISESEGLDRDHMRLPKSQLHLLKSLHKVNKNIIVILSAGSSVEMPWLSYAKAVVHGYLCGQAGAGAMFKVLLGEVNPSGKLSETFPVKYEDVPSAPYFPAKERTVEYREGPYIGYRYFDTTGEKVAFPFGYGLSYTTFAYSDLTVSKTAASFTITNTGERDGAEIAQLYVNAKTHGVFRPSKELKGFTKVFLKAGEAKNVTIPLDDKAFRYFNIKTNKFEIEGGEYQILVGASLEDLRLSRTIAIEGTDAPLPYDMEKLPSYFSGRIKNISDGEFQELLGHPIPDGSWSGRLTMNDAICQLSYARSFKARLVYKVMTHMLKKSIKKGNPDLNIIFTYNMPFRAIGKMTGGMVSIEMCEGILTIVNGHAIALFKGLGQILGGFLRLRKNNKYADSLK